MNIQNTGSRNFEKLRRMPHYLDWANMPDPFRHYEGVPILDLPADPPAPQIPALDVLGGKMGTTLARDGAAFLSQLMFYSASISASKRVPSTGSTYALRVNPSSGNLHPTEFHSALATTNRYVHLSQNHLADAQKRIEAYRQEKAFAEAQEAAPLSKQTT